MSAIAKAEENQLRGMKHGEGIARFFKVIDKPGKTLPENSGAEDVTNDEKTAAPSIVTESVAEDVVYEKHKTGSQPSGDENERNDPGAVLEEDPVALSPVKSSSPAEISNNVQTTKAFPKNPRSKSKKTVGPSRKRKKLISADEEVTYMSYADFKKQDSVECIDTDDLVSEDIPVVEKRAVDEPASPTKNRCQRESGCTVQAATQSFSETLINGDTEIRRKRGSSVHEERDDADGSVTDIEPLASTEPVIPDLAIDNGFPKLRRSSSGEDKISSVTASSKKSNKKAPKSSMKTAPGPCKDIKSFCESFQDVKTPKRCRGLVDSDIPSCEVSNGKSLAASETADTGCDTDVESLKSKRRCSDEGEVALMSSRRRKKASKFAAKPELESPCKNTPKSKKAKRLADVEELPAPVSEDGQARLRRSSRLRNVATANYRDEDQAKSPSKSHGCKHASPKSGDRCKSGSSPQQRNGLGKASLQQKGCNGSSAPLAPLFVKKASKLSTKMDPAMLEKRKSFLMSGIPERLQKQIQRSDACSNNCAVSAFTTIPHVQQRGANGPDSLWHLEVPEALAGFDEGGGTTSCIERRSLRYGSFTGCEDARSISESLKEGGETADPKQDAGEILAEIRQNNNSLDVEAIYRGYLRKRRSAWLDESNDEILTSGPKDSPDCVQLSGNENAPVQKRKVSPEEIPTRKGNPVQKVSKNNGKDAEAAESGTSTANDLANNCSSDLWTMVYQPDAARDIVDNDKCVKKLTSWLQQWKKVCLTSCGEEQGSSNQKKKRNGFSRHDSDYDGGSDCGEDKDDLRNTVLLLGPNGCGKTSTVFALAKELGFEVIEVNAATKRTGKLVLSRLREATQSHHVNDSKSLKSSPSKVKSSVSSGKDGQKSNAASKGSKAASQNPEKVEENGPAPVSLILFEDVDVVFGEDDGFWSAVNTFMSSAKRPIILTSSDLKFGQRDCIKEDYDEVKFRKPDLVLQALHLQLMALAELCFCPSKDLIRLVEINCGDFRRSVLTLQFYCKRRHRRISRLAEGEMDDADICDEDVTEEKSVSESAALEEVVDPLSGQIVADCRGLPDSFCPRGLSVGKLFEIHAEVLGEVQSPVLPPEGDGEGPPRLPRSGDVQRLVRIAGAADRLVDSDVMLRDESRAFENGVQVAPGLEDEERVEDERRPTEVLLRTVDAFLSLQHSSLRAGRSNSSALGSSDRLKEPVIRPEWRCDEEPRDILSTMPLDTRLHSRDFYLDYLPVLRNVCRAESFKNSTSTKRRGRITHYLSSNVLYLDKDTISWLGQQFGGGQDVECLRAAQLDIRF